MKLLSHDFEDNNIIPSKFTCDGKNISPHLCWVDIPNGVKSFALVVNDPDALGGWIHWQVYDVSKETKEIKQNSLPVGAREVENDFGKKGYGGPCPPSGTHRYIFTLYALDVEHLENVNKYYFLKEIKAHTIKKASIKGLYKRRL